MPTFSLQLRHTPRMATSVMGWDSNVAFSIFCPVMAQRSGWARTLKVSSSPYSPDSVATAASPAAVVERATAIYSVIGLGKTTVIPAANAEAPVAAMAPAILAVEASTLPATLFRCAIFSCSSRGP
jgi:hypothetical protein